MSPDFDSMPFVDSSRDCGSPPAQCPQISSMARIGLDSAACGRRPADNLRVVLCNVVRRTRINHRSEIVPISMQAANCSRIREMNVAGAMDGIPRSPCPSKALVHACAPRSSVHLVMGSGLRAVAVSRLFANGFERRQQSKVQQRLQELEAMKKDLLRKMQESTTACTRSKRS